MRMEMRISAGRGVLAAVVAVALLGGCLGDPPPDVLLERAGTAYQKGDYLAAVLDLKSALKQNPDLAEARYLLGAVYNEGRDGASAEKELKRAEELQLVKGGRVRAELARALVLQEMYKEALQRAQPSPGFEPDATASLLAIRGRAHIGLRQLEEARKALAEAAQAKADNPDVLLLEAALVMREKGLADAVSVLDRLLAKHPKNVEGLMVKADLLIMLDRDTDALAVYDKLIEIGPRYYPSRAARAALDLKLGKLDEAQKDVDAMGKLVKRNYMTSYLQARIHFQRAKYRDALASIQDSLAIAPEYPPAQFLAGATHYALGSLAQAEKLLAEFVRSHPRNGPARKLLARVLVDLNQGNRALEVVQPMVGKDLRDTAVLALAGDAAMRSGNFNLASEYFSRAANTDPGSPGLRTQLAMSRLAAGDVDRAITELEAVTRTQGGGGDRAELLLVMTHLQAKNYQKAMEVADQLVAKQPKNPLSHTLAGMVRDASGDREGARKSFNQALSVSPTYFAAVAKLAQLDLDDGKPAAARERLEAFLNKDPRSLAAMMALAELAGRQQQTAESVKWLEKARETSPTAIEPRARLASHYLMNKDPRKAMEIAKEAVANNPDHPAALDVLGAMQLSSGEANAAVGTFQRLVAVTPRQPEAHQKLAVALYRAGSRKEAETAYRQALNLDPALVEAHLALASLLIESGRLDAAAASIASAKKFSPRLVSGSDVPGDLLFAQKKYPQALKAYEEANAQGPSGTLAIKVYMAQSRSGDPKAGLERLERWVKDNPDDVRARSFLADGYLATRQYTLAAEHYIKVIEKAPKAFMAWNNLAMAYAETGNPKALDAAERAYGINGDNPLVADTLGWLLLQKGDTARSLGVLAKANRAAPEVPEIGYHYAAALAKSGDKAAARAQLDKVIKSGKAFPQKDEAKALLRQLEG